MSRKAPTPPPYKQNEDGTPVEVVRPAPPPPPPPSPRARQPNRRSVEFPPKYEVWVKRGKPLPPRPTEPSEPTFVKDECSSNKDKQQLMVKKSTVDKMLAIALALGFSLGVLVSNFKIGG